MSAPSRTDQASGRRVAVIGGGISGLAAAWRITDGSPALEVIVLEGSTRFGGILRLGTIGDIEVDLGAEAMLARRPEALALARDAGLAADLTHPATTTASLVRDARLHPLPTGTIMGVPGNPAALRGLLTDDEIARVAVEPSLPVEPLTNDVDVATWLSGRMGPAVVDRLVEPLLGGVYAGHARRLSLRATLPPIWQIASAGRPLLTGVAELTAIAAAETATGTAAGTAAGTLAGTAAPSPVFAGIRGGVGRLPGALAEGLRARGAVLRAGAMVRDLERTATGWRLTIGPTPTAEILDVDAVVLAIPPAAAARLLARVSPAASTDLAGIETASVAVVTVLVPRSAMGALSGSGVLIPPTEGLALKAMTFSSLKWAWVDALAPEHAVVRLSLGRHREEAVLQHDDAQLTALAITDAERLLRRPLTPVATRVTRWGGALAQYAVGHVDRVTRIRTALAPLDGLAVCGAAFDGVGIAACVASAELAARSIRQHLPSPRGTVGRGTAGRGTAGQ